MFQKRLTLSTLSVAVAAALATVATYARCAPLDDMQADLDALRAKVADLEKAQRAAEDRSINVVTGGSSKGSFKLPGTDTSVTLGGYVKLDAIFSNPSAGVGSTADQELEAGGIPVGPSEEQRAKPDQAARAPIAAVRWHEHADPVRRPFDLCRGRLLRRRRQRNREQLQRLSHAACVRKAGRAARRPDMDHVCGRQCVSRDGRFRRGGGGSICAPGTDPLDQPFAKGEWSIALENPETIVSLPSGSQFRADDDRVPDVAGIVRFDTGRGKYSIAGVVRQLRVDSASAPASRQTKLGAAIGVNGVVPYFGTDDVRFSIYYGNAIGRYSTGFLSDAVLDASGNMTLPTQWLATVAVRHFWTPTLRSTLALSGVGSSNPAGTAAAVNRSAESAHLNLIWSPVARTNLGVEYILARREVQNGDTGNLNRLQVSAQYSF